MLSRSKNSLAVVGTSVAAALLLAACSSDAGEATGDARESSSANVVATTTQVGSLVEQITACGGGEAQTLMTAGDDPHQFEVSSAQVADMVSADLVISNGLGLESAMQRSLDNAVSDGAELFELAPELDPLPYGGDHEHHGEEHDHDEHDHDHGEYDSHVWLDVSRMADGAELIGQQIAAASGDDAYIDCGQEVATELREVDAEVEGILSALDTPRLVTDHAAYGYFADRYGVEISGVVIPGGSTDGEPSSKELAELTNLLNEQGADALVTSQANTNPLVTALAEETTNDVPVVALYEGGIGEPGSEADTYQDAMLYNAKALVDALQ
ncbi:metal ABC transporter substrate-binding protein [Yaniella halotolerans]|uniref:metal ABC transporter substrate-binding protein n=1 Tax=Yaniella halotolerans TaxID=225453 RepID=UPI0003B3D498|nr:metal ABC transporter substrate-binding protein [Yaniella halotolerans]